MAGDNAQSSTGGDGTLRRWRLTVTRRGVLKSVLFIVFQFPPFTGSSAVQRALRFTRYLPEHGWQPIVLTVKASAYEHANPDLLRDIPPGTVVERAFSFDAARHFGIARRYPSFLARPDRWRSWRHWAVPAALRLIRQHGIDAIWSTYPIPTAHVIARAVQEKSGLPWVADFRDPMTLPNDPADPALWASYHRVELETVHHASACVFTTPGTCALYRQRYPDVPASHMHVVENGYDEEVFATLPAAAAGDPGTPFVLLHSGAIYPLERDPSHLFAALRTLADAGAIHPGNFRLRLRATFHDDAIRPLVTQAGVEALVEFAPPVPYREALSEMCAADALLVLQAREVKTQIPAKLYEYLRVGRPILALTDPDSDTAQVLHRAGLSAIVPLDDAGAIVAALRRLLEARATGHVVQPDTAMVQACSRRARAAELAQVLDDVVVPTIAP